MKVLILSCATGEGHNSAAQAIREYFKLHKIECEVVDTLSLISPAASQTASDLYIFSTRTRLFKLLYHAGTIVSDYKSKSPVYFANKLYCGKLLEYIKINEYDTIICNSFISGRGSDCINTSKKTSSTECFHHDRLYMYSIYGRDSIRLLYCSS